MPTIQGHCAYCGTPYGIPANVDKVTPLVCVNCGQGIVLDTVINPLAVHSGGRTYLVDGSPNPAQQGIYNIYPAVLEDRGLEKPFLLKVAREPKYNEVAKYEARILKHLQGGVAAKDYEAFIPELVESFTITDKKGVQRWCNVFTNPTGWYSLAQVRAKYTAGVNPKDMAWMYRRVLTAIGFAHINNVLHCAVLPSNVWIEPEHHGLIIRDWQYAIGPGSNGTEIQGIDSYYRDLYPAAVLNSIPPTTGTDVFMAAKSMNFILGDDIPNEINEFLEDCLNKGARDVDVWEIKESFDALIEQLWGKRKFHKFTM